MSNITTLNIPIYEGKIILAVETTAEEIQAEAAKLKSHLNEDDITELMTILSEDNYFNKIKSYKNSGFEIFKNKVGIIYLNNHDSEVDLMNTLSHEISHYVGDLLNQLEVPYNNDTTEIYAYLTGYVTQETYRYLKSINKV